LNERKGRRLMMGRIRKRKAKNGKNGKDVETKRSRIDVSEGVI
jgi:hypothetical protein